MSERQIRRQADTGSYRQTNINHYTVTQTNSCTDRKTEIQTNRQTKTHAYTHRQINRLTDRHRDMPADT